MALLADFRSRRSTGKPSTRIHFVSRETALAGGCILLSFALELWLSSVLNIWKDEAFTLVSTSRTIAYAFHRAIGFEQNAPCYFVLLTLFRVINSSIVFARVFSTVCVAATLVVCVGVSRRYLQGVSAAWYVMFLAVNPFLVWAATEIRLYAFAILLSAALMLTFHDAFLSEQRGTRARLVFAVVAVVAIYTEYFFLFTLIGMGGALLVTRRWRELRSFVFIAAIVGVAFLPLIAVLPSQASSYRAAYEGYQSAFVSVRDVTALAAMNAVPTEWLPRSGKLPWLLIVGAVLICAVASKERLASRAQVPAIVAVSAVLGLGIATYFAKVPLLNRHLAFAFVPTSLTIVAIVADIRHRVRGMALLVLVVIAIFTSAASLAAVYRPLAKAGDAKRVASYLMKHERPGQPIFVFLADEALPIEYYYRGTNKVFPLPSRPSDTRYDMRTFVLHDERQISRAIATAGDRRTVWLVASTNDCQPFHGLVFGCAVLNRFVASHAAVIDKRVFYKVTVSKLQLRSFR